MPRETITETENPRVRWSATEDRFIREHWQEMPDTVMAQHLGRSPHAICSRRSVLRLSRREDSPRLPWSKEELEYLELAWGSKPIPAIASRLGRSAHAVESQANRMGLFGQMAAGDMMSLAAVTQMLGLKSTGTVLGWMKQGLVGQKVSLRQNISYYKLHKSPQTHYVFRMGHVLNWLENHQDAWDSRRVPLYGLGVEYPWLVEKRQADKLRDPIRRPWTQQEVSYLKTQVGRGIPYSTIAKELNRSKRGVKAKGHELGLRSGSLKKSQKKRVF